MSSFSIRRSSMLYGGVSAMKRLRPSSFETHSDSTNCQALVVLVPI